MCGDLRRHADVAGQRVGRYKFNFIDFDRASLARDIQSFFDLLGYVLGFRSRDRKGAHQAGKVLNSNVFREMQAGQTGRGQELAEAAFRLTSL